MKNNNFIWFLILCYITTFFMIPFLFLDNGECPELYYAMGMNSIIIPLLITYLIFHRKKKDLKQ